MSEGPITAAIEITNPTGLHARPAVKLTKLAKSFAAKIALAFDSGGPWIDAKSVVKVMALKAPQGAILHFTAQGADAAAAINELVDLVRRDFDEGPHAARAAGVPEPGHAD
ncbi:HPr family phosphocarrier protein [Dongia sp.]|uniref:HPr family phosphocarrier protein n=1 Tax=Dongia sp. TaxID=1977262 RepID=UPI0035B0B5A3